MTARAVKNQVGVCIGKSGRPIGELTYVRDGAREYSAFVYDKEWLSHP